MVLLKYLKDKHMRRNKKSLTLLETKPRRQNPPTGFTHIKEVIDGILGTSALPIDFDGVRIWKLWDGVVGKSIAKHARPSSIKKGVLMVKVTDSVWVQELEFKAETIRESLNRKLQREAVKKIRFRVGTPQESKQISKKRSQQEHIQDLTPERQRKMEEIIAQIKDKEMRESLRQIMILAAKKDNVR
jgi:hypothetical protein